MNSEIQIVPLSRNSREVLRFLKVSYLIYRDDPHWVAPLLMDLKKVFLDGNPLFEHAEMQLWIVVKGGQDVGRIAGILDRNFVESQNDKAVFFGFFECINDAEVSGKLFAAVFEWARAKGMNRVLGPMNPTSNDECGLLVEGFDSSPTIMLTYNPRYYLDLFSNQGLNKAKDLLAYHIDLAKTPMERFGRIAEKTKKRWPELKFRPIRRKTLEQDLSKIKEIYNQAWEENWGFVPMTDAEVDFMASRLKPLLMEGIVWLTEAGEEPVGFLLALPDYNVPMKPLRGRICTPKILGFIPYLFGWKYPPLSRVMAMGVKRRYRGKGLEAVMLFEGLKAGLKVGFVEAEASWILEDNTMMCRVMEVFGATAYKTYRLYDREI